jgi:hypothetical protein
VSFLTAIQTYLAASTGSERQRREAEEAAQAIGAVAFKENREQLEGAFWASLQRGYWQMPSRREDADLEERSRLDRASIEENYRDMFPRFDYNKATEIAAKAWERRVNTCAEAIRNGVPLSACVSYVYCKQEWAEAVNKAHGR